MSETPCFDCRHARTDTHRNLLKTRLGPPSSAEQRVDFLDIHASCRWISRPVTGSSGQFTTDCANLGCRGFQKSCDWDCGSLFEEDFPVVLGFARTSLMYIYIYIARPCMPCLRVYGSRVPPCAKRKCLQVFVIINIGSPAHLVCFAGRWGVPSCNL